MSGTLKASTKLTGIPVATNPIKDLKILYSKILSILSSMPASSSYRVNTEKIIDHRLTIIKESETPKMIEEKIQCGQIEELLMQAKEELACAKTMAKYKVWEPLETLPPKNQWKWPIK